MALSFENQSQTVIAEISNDQRAEKYACAFTVCPRPSCGCRVIQLDLSPLDTVDSDSRPVSRYVKINLFDKSLEPMKKDKPPLEELHFAKRFLACLNDADFDLLSKKHFEIKNLQTEAANPDTIDAHFDFRSIERNGTMSGYNDVLPYADRLHATVAGKKYRIFDQYCLQPNCLCTDANLCVFDLDKSDQRGKELCCIGVNYKSNVWTVVDGGSLPLEPDVLRSAMENEIPDLYDVLFKRHIKLKTIYAFSKKKLSVCNQPLLVPKIGRNDLCPCGSGKKFKKCCADK